MEKQSTYSLIAAKQKDGFTVALLDSYRRFDPEAAELSGCKMDVLEVFTPISVDEAIDTCVMLCEHGVFIFAI